MQKKSDDAVSPVIGVMLMLVVTIVIAGVIAAFGTGMTTDMEPAPNVVLDVEIINYDMMLDGGAYGTLSGPDFRITHVSGDTLDTGDIELRFSWTNRTGTKFHSTYSTDTHTDIYTLYVEVTSAYLNGKNGDMGITFGEAELEPGFTLKTGVKFLGDITADTGEHIGSPYMDRIFNNNEVITKNTFNDKGIMEHLEKGTKVDVTILHIPSNSIIYDKAVYVK